MINFLIQFIPNFLLQYFPTDKILHFFVSFFLLIFIFFIRKFLLKNRGFIRIFAYSFRDVIIIGIFKEIIDLFGFGKPELGDLIANFSGLIIPIYIFFLIKFSPKLKRSKKLLFEKRMILDFKFSKKIGEKIKIFLFLSLIWFLNIFYLTLKIPFLALKETIDFIKKLFFIKKL